MAPVGSGQQVWPAPPQAAHVLLPPHARPELQVAAPPLVPGQQVWPMPPHGPQTFAPAALRPQVRPVLQVGAAPKPPAPGQQA